MVEKNLKKLQAKKRRVTNGFNTGTRDMRLKTAYRRKKNWSADADQYSFAKQAASGHFAGIMRTFSKKARFIQC